ncbi:peptidoglycan-binding domain-containing protein [Methylobacterium nonmethylotrophicum]|uniref:Peptidoglycan-binding protein n=1 Tax=Methylobacterium nonmethylotrophicum TaxID=1141884 RepID=A0A4Z0NJU5_9HYPH|nr:peptidoglycan-binding domain-containing protein [Methylobacterium nonmethylotrophicum]TGD96310.1 peptidoglycan-binding protein [Methylobacterium nonmethylotrophicum]
MSEAPARPPAEATARPSGEATARRRDPDVGLTAEARPAPRPRSAPRAARAPRVVPRPAGALDRLRGRADRIVRHPAGIVGLLLALGAVAAVAANALSFQTGRHPAPLFAKAPPRPAADPAPAPTVRADAARAGRPDAPKAGAADGIGALIGRDDHTTASVSPKAAPAKPAKAPPRESAVKEAAVKEAVGKEAAKSAPEVRPPASVREAKAPDAAKALHAAPPAAAAKADKSVAYAQRALVKLGYGPLTVDGIAGPGTRAALARFERERRLPGASVARRTLKELEARSGLKPE